MGERRTIVAVLAVCAAVLLAPRSARADSWGCDGISVPDYLAGHCCDFHDECYAQHDCEADFQGRWEAAALCAECDMRGENVVCEMCYYAQWFYTDDACYDCDHRAVQCIANSTMGICPAGPNECSGVYGDYPANNVCGETREHPGNHSGRGCESDEFCMEPSTCDRASGDCVMPDGRHIPPPAMAPWYACWPECNELPAPAYEDYQCGFILTFSTCADGLGWHYQSCDQGSTCSDDHRCLTPQACWTECYDIDVGRCDDCADECGWDGCDAGCDTVTGACLEEIDPEDCWNECYNTQRGTCGDCASQCNYSACDWGCDPYTGSCEEDVTPEECWEECYWDQWGMCDDCAWECGYSGCQMGCDDWTGNCYEDWEYF